MQTIKKKLARALLVCTVTLVICRKVSGQGTNLTLSPTIVNEDSPQNLTCVYNGNQAINSVSWFVNDVLEGVLNANNGVCSKTFWRHANLHSYSCDVSSKTFTLTILNVKRSNRTDIWRCTMSFVNVAERDNSNNATPSVKIFITSVTITFPLVNTITLQENSSQQFTCVTSGGLPEPIVKWYNDSKTPGDRLDDKEITSLITTSYNNTSDDLIRTISTLTVTTSKYDNQMNIYCSAYVSTDQAPLISEQKLKLNVIYGPDGPPIIQGFAAGDTYRVIENRQGQLTCYIKGGNPLPTLSWTCFNAKTSNNTKADTVSKTAIWTAVRGQDKTCICRSSHSNKNESVEIQVEILYPPTTPAFYIKGTEVSGTVKVIKNNQVSIECRSSGKPNQIQYTWKHNLATTSGATLTTSSVQNGDQYTCEVGNSMNSSSGSIVPGKNSSFLSFEVLYPPEVSTLQNKNVAEGQSFSYNCPVKVGNPNKTLIKWTKSDGKEWGMQTLTIQNVSRTDAAFYNCTAENLMKQTGEQTATRGSDSKSFHLNVWYKAKVTDFYVEGFRGNISVTVNETRENVLFRCIVDSNPESSMTIQTEKKQLQSGSDLKSLVYELSSASCLNAGVYTCFGKNNYNTKQSLKQLNFFVNCSPRLSPFSQLETNVTSQQNKSAVLTFTALAHPLPSKEDFKWFRQENGLSLPLLNDATFRIDTNHLTSNLTILDINRTLYGTYRLHVKNAFGKFEQLFYLLPEDKPEEPTNFIHIQELVTESSFTVEWKPGFDNGPKQSFILQYRKESQQEWIVNTIPDSGEPVMNYTVSDLSSGTKYQVILYAFNRLGNSTETDFLTISTKALQDEPNYGPLIGGLVSGGVVCVALFVVLGVIVMRRFNTNKGNAKSKTDKNDRKRVYEDDENDYGMQDNPMYVSAGPLGETSGGSGEAGPVYSAVDKSKLFPEVSKNDIYAEVNKPKKAKANYGKKEKPEKGKHGFKKDKKGKKGTQDGDIYENATVADTKTKQKSNDETIYENPEPSNPKKNVNKDGLIYADLTFNDNPKGQKKLVIHGLDSMTEYVEVDFTKKADPLPDSDDENVPPK